MSTETYDDLLSAILSETSREAVQAAAEPPADHVRAIPVRRLVAEAPALPPMEPLKLPRLTEKTMNGERIKELIKAGPAAALVQTVDGLDIKPLREVEHNNEVVVLTDWRTAAKRVNVDGIKPSTAAREILQREQQVHRLLQAAS